MSELNEECKARYEEMKNEPTEKKVIAFLIAFISSYSGTQGFYDCFSILDNPIKLHYSAKYTSFRLDEKQSDLAIKHLFFVPRATALVTIPFHFEGEDKFVEERVMEIKERAPEYIYKAMIREINSYLKPYSDLKDFRITIRPKWSKKVSIDSAW